MTKEHKHDYWPAQIGYEPNEDFFIVRYICINTDEKDCDSYYMTAIEAEDT